MRLILSLAVRNLLQAPRRSGLLGLAIGLVTAMLVLLLSMGAGIEDNLVESATTMSSGHVTVGGFYKTAPGDAAPLVTDMSEVKAVIEANTPGLDYVIDRHRGWCKLVSVFGSTNAGVAGVDIAQEQRLLDTLTMAKESEYADDGRDEVIGDPKRLSEPNTTLLFVNQARTLGVKVGDVLTLQAETNTGALNTVDIEVVAVARDLGMMSSWTIFTPKEVVLDLYALPTDTTGAVWVYLDDIDNAEAVMGHLRTVFEENGYRVMDHAPVPFFFKFDVVSGEDWVGQKLDLTIWRDEVSFLVWVITAFNTVVWFMVAVLVSIIAVGIMNALYTAVRERTGEIGTMRAIGMSRSRVLFLILSEAAILGLASTTVGALFGAAVALGIDAAAVPVPLDAMQFVLLSDTLRLSVRPGTVLFAIVSLSFFCAFASLWPARRAARMPPITAIGHAE